MSDEEIILTNTYCNSKNKFNNIAVITQNNGGVETRKRSNSRNMKNAGGVTWKKDLVV